MTDAIRESFEAWAKSQRICVDLDPRGGYVWRSSQTAWEAWQAGRLDGRPEYYGDGYLAGWEAVMGPRK